MALIENYRRHQYHAVLLHGPEGVGLSTVADQLRRSIDVPEGHVLTIVPEPGVRDISIDQIRQLYSATRSIRSQALIVLVDEAERMSLEAQNGLLKLIEEPPKGAKFILTSHQRQLLLPTIISRVIDMEIQPISLQDSQKLADDLSNDKTKNQQVLFLASGLPALITKLLRDDEYFTQQVGIVRDAKSFVTSGKYERYKVAASYTKDRERALLLLKTTGRLLMHATQRGTTDHKKMLALSETIDHIKANGNLRIHLQSLINQL